MTAEQILTLLKGVKPTTKGWTAICPAHADHSPSLTITEGTEGRTLLWCFAGCAVKDICAALGLTIRELFIQPEPPKRIPKPFRSLKPSRRPSDIAFQFQLHAMDLFLRAEKVLSVAKHLDSSQWTEAEADRALEMVSRAYMDLSRADCLERVACDLRGRELRHERARYAPRHSKA